ncbi:EamA family transporter [bacterium]|nr:EamA family transporter [bacterium]
MSRSFKIVLAFAAIYLIWGSTYLAIKFAIATIPPFLMAGARFLVAGAIMYVFARLRNSERPTPLHWRSATIIGGLLLMGGNGGVTWAEQYVPSGLTALLIATVPLWITVLNWLHHDRIRPGVREIGSVLLGLIGLAILVGPEELIGKGRIDLIGAGVLITASLLWSFGSLYSRHAPLPSNPLLSIGMEMLAGGAILAVVGLASGETARIDLSAVSAQSIWSILYLILVGALIGFTAYVWLLKQTSPNLVATYAYVNPVVAVFLGWLLAGEELTFRTMLAATVIVAAVVIVTLKPKEKIAAVPVESKISD